MPEQAFIGEAFTVQDVRRVAERDAVLLAVGAVQRHRVHVSAVRRQRRLYPVRVVRPAARKHCMQGRLRHPSGSACMPWQRQLLMPCNCKKDPTLLLENSSRGELAVPALRCGVLCEQRAPASPQPGAASAARWRCRFCAICALASSFRRAPAFLLRFLLGGSPASPSAARGAALPSRLPGAAASPGGASGSGSRPGGCAGVA